MAFIPKEWKKRIVEFPGRRKLAQTSEDNVFDVVRNEGSVMQEGDAFTTNNMNNMEQRIANEFNTVNSNLTALNSKINLSGTYVVTVVFGKLQNTVLYSDFIAFPNANKYKITITAGVAQNIIVFDPRYISIRVVNKLGFSLVCSAYAGIIDGYVAEVAFSAVPI